MSRRYFFSHSVFVHIIDWALPISSVQSALYGNCQRINFYMFLAIWFICIRELDGSEHFSFSFSFVAVKCNTIRYTHNRSLFAHLHRIYGSKYPNVSFIPIGINLIFLFTASTSDVTETTSMCNNNFCFFFVLFSLHELLFFALQHTGALLFSSTRCEAKLNYKTIFFALACTTQKKSTQQHNHTKVSV